MMSEWVWEGRKWVGEAFKLDFFLRRTHFKNFDFWGFPNRNTIFLPALSVNVKIKILRGAGDWKLHISRQLQNPVFEDDESEVNDQFDDADAVELNPRVKKLQKRKRKPSTLTKKSQKIKQKKKEKTQEGRSPSERENPAR